MKELSKNELMEVEGGGLLGIIAALVIGIGVVVMAAEFFYDVFNGYQYDILDDHNLILPD